MGGRGDTIDLDDSVTNSELLGAAEKGYYLKNCLNQPNKNMTVTGTQFFLCSKLMCIINIFLV